jgi:predicted site-specific integrase-resolvase
MTAPTSVEKSTRDRKETVMNKGMRIGYARVSSSGQKLDIQLDRLADCDRVFHEKVSGKSTKGRPELKNALVSSMM